MSSKNGYNNEGFNEKNDKFDLRKDKFNKRYEVGGYQAVNETFVDDNGQDIYCDESESYVDFINQQQQQQQQQQQLHCGPGCRSSVALVVDNGQQLRRIPADSYSRSLCVGYHRVDTTSRLPRHRYESISSDERYSEPRVSGPIQRHEYETIDALHRRYEEIEAANEEYVDYPEDRMGTLKKETYLPTRESPLGSSGTIKHIETTRMNITPVSTPKKLQMTTPPKSSIINISPKETPKRSLTRRNTIILAPMLANIEKQQRNNAINLHRSRSTIITSPRRRNRDDLTTSPAMALVHPSRISPQKGSHIYSHCNPSFSKTIQNVAPPLRYHIPLKLPSFNHIIESESTYERTRNINRRPNTAIITPNTRSSVVSPLLSPVHLERSPPPVKSPSTFSKASWATLPTIHLPTEMLCCVGFLLLSAGAATAILCFYLLAIAGRRYFLNFGAIAGFASLLLGLFSCRTNKWKWLPHRNYMTGYIMLTTFSILNSACLGGIVYALEDKSYALLDTLGGAVCGISVIVILGTIVGMVTSGCCHRPPPDNRVAHGVPGFIV